MKVPGPFDVWPDDPGPSPGDHPPFSFQLGERFAFGLVKPDYVYQYRAEDGAFVFRSLGLDVPLHRSAWRLKMEYFSGALTLPDRKGPANVTRAVAAALDRHPAFVLAHCSAKTIAKLNRDWAYVNAVIEEDKRRSLNGQGPLPRSGPSDLGYMPAKYPPTCLGELVCNVAAERKEEIPRSWTRVNLDLRKVIGGPVAYSEQTHRNILLDGRSVAAQPSRLHPEVQKIITTHIHDRFLVTQPETITGLTKRVRDAVTKENECRPPETALGKPSRGAVERYVATIPGLDIVNAQGKHKQRQRCYRVTGVRPLPPAPLDHVVFDWQQLSFEVRASASHPFMDPKGRPVGRLWLGLFTDVFTGGPLGFAVSIRNPSRAFFLTALRTVLLPKLKSGIQHEWPLTGLMKILEVDRDASLMSDATRASLERLGITFKFVPPRDPPAKPDAESPFSALQREIISKWPGWIGESPERRPEERTPDHLLMDIDEVFAKLTEYFVDYKWIKTPSSRDLSAQRLLAEFRHQNPNWAPDLPESRMQLELALSIEHTGHVTTRGVTWSNLQFNSIFVHQILSDWQRHTKEELSSKARPLRARFWISPNRIDCVRIEHPMTGEIGWAFCTKANYAVGKTMDQHLIVDAARRALKIEAKNASEDYLNRVYVSLTDHCHRQMAGKARRQGVRDAARFLEVAPLFTPTFEIFQDEIDAEALRTASNPHLVFEKMLESRITAAQQQPLLESSAKPPAPEEGRGPEPFTQDEPPELNAEAADNKMFGRAGPISHYTEGPGGEGKPQWDMFATIGRSIEATSVHTDEVDQPDDGLDDDD
ncbi:hypothetical protein [Mesorhizobium sp.]|uniref:hypothetical protein n=1 Tax=Mesorhizobium sp. TaxID=1871066 RepID=UPI000FE50DA8|nr:hypothetical protein [Mesorhizobium sp.]RWM39903.1 MAG: hypothetical protein EOR75_12035 [Mesorhizobium sp.]